LTGTLPTELATLNSLGAFAFNVINGNYPKSSSSSSKFAETLGLAENALVGTIPGEYAALDRLERLRLENNDLSGTIPVEMSDMTNLEILSLNNNTLDRYCSD
jgi:Leucine-rich repeat (LRR) protein